jgi:hypothetical protein
MNNIKKTFLLLSSLYIYSTEKIIEEEEVFFSESNLLKEENNFNKNQLKNSLILTKNSLINQYIDKNFNTFKSKNEQILIDKNDYTNGFLEGNKYNIPKSGLDFTIKKLISYLLFMVFYEVFF